MTSVAQLHPSTLMAAPERAHALRALALAAPSLTLSQRQICDLELLLNGGFAPLSGFLGQADYQAVLETTRLADGTLWPIPVTLDLSEADAEKVGPGAHLALRDGEGALLAVMQVSDLWRPDLQQEATQVYGTTSVEHAGVRQLLEQTRAVYVGGRVEGLQLPAHFDFQQLRHSPAELRQIFASQGWRKVVAFHTSQPMHRLQHELILRAARQASAHVLLHPAVGVTRPRDLATFARVKCYQAIARHFPHGLAQLSLLPLAMRMAGPRGALWHALVRRNHGCTHFVIGSDHASPPEVAGKRFYPSNAARELAEAHQDELGIGIVGFDALGYAPSRRRFVPRREAGAAGETLLELSHDALVERLSRGQEPPDWYSYPEVLQILRRVYPPRSRQGFTLFFTGLSGAGKSTLAQILYGRLIEEGSRPVTLLDGDIVRQNLSSELGFSREHRELNVRRIGFVASEITKNGGVAICAPIAPYAASRRHNRELIAQHGAYIEIHVATPLEVCEARDRKGLYAKARQGLVANFTGISDPYEVPEAPELRIDTSQLSPMEAAQEIYLYLLGEGFLDGADDA